MIISDKTSQGNSIWSRIVGFLQAYEWWLIGITFLTIICIGWYGFSQLQHSAEAGQYSALDNLYLALQLFVMNSGDQRNISASLQIARFLAPIVVAWASIKALWPLLREPIYILKLNSYKNHIVICGLGKKGMELVNIFRKLGKKVVVIEIDEENDNLAGCKQRGGIVLIGNAQDDFLLKKANIQHAGYLFAVTGDDNANVAIAGKAHALLKDIERRERPLQCFIHIFDIRLRNLFEQHEIFTRGYEQFNARLFNVYEESARFILGKYAPDSFAKCNDVISPPVNILIVGFGWTGESIAEQAIRMGHYGNEKNLMITIVDKMAIEKKSKFLSLYQKSDTPDAKFIVDDIELDFIEMDIESLYSLEDLKVNYNNPPAAVYICLGNDTLGTFAAVRLRKMFDSYSPPIVVCLKEGDSTLFESENFNRRNENIHGFNMPEYACSKHIETETDLDELARLVHSKYVVDCLGFSIKDFHDETAVEAFCNAISGNKYDKLSPSLKKLWDEIDAGNVSDRTDGMLKKMNILLRTPGFYDVWSKRHSEIAREIMAEAGIRRQKKTHSAEKLYRNIAKFSNVSRGYRVKIFNELNIFEQEIILRLNLSILLTTYKGNCPDLLERNSSLIRWEDLTEDIKDSNRYQADHIPIKLRALGFDPGKDIPIETLLLKLSDSVVMGKMARIEHKRWMAEKILAGWRYSEKRDNIKRKHNLLIPFEELADEQIKKDFGSINNIPLLISTQNWKTYQKLIKADTGV